MLNREINNYESHTKTNLDEIDNQKNLSNKSDESSISKYPKSKYLKDRNIGLIGVSIKEGQNLDGPELAPEHFRKGGLFQILESLGWNYTDFGNLDNENLDLGNLKLDNNKNYKYSNLKNSLEIGAANKKLNEITKKISETGSFALTLGGDHGIATGSISGVKTTYPDLKIIWVDAHGDCNLPENSPSGNYHGMPVAHLLGWIPEGTIPGFDWLKPCLSSPDIVYIALRDVDAAEKKCLAEYGIKCFSMHEITKIGISSVIEQTLKYFQSDGKEHPIHISFDIDSVDPLYAPGTGTKARGGLNYREAHYLMREVASSGNLVSLDMVEVNPLIDSPKERYHGDSKFIEGTLTVCLALELIASALGETLL